MEVKRGEGRVKKEVREFSEVKEVRNVGRRGRG